MASAPAPKENQLPAGARTAARRTASGLRCEDGSLGESSGREIQMRFVLPLLCCCSAMLFMLCVMSHFVAFFFGPAHVGADGPIRVCVGPLRTFLHSRVYLSPVGRVPKFDKFEFASAHHVDFYTVVFI